MEKMENILYGAALNNDVNTLSHLLMQDPNLLERTNFNCADKNPLHIAVMQGHLAFVQEILEAKDSLCMCLGRDRDGRNPLHLAAMYDKRSELVKLTQKALPAALEKADGGGTILHLCVKYNRLETLELLLDIFTNKFTNPEFVCAKNDDGMTILHLAVYYNQSQSRRSDMITCLINKTGTEMVNIKNANGKTALELVLEQGKIPPVEFIKVMGNRKKLNRLLRDNNGVCRPILQSLAEAGALTGYDAMSSREMHAKLVSWLETRRDSVMVVAALIATMAFQAMVSPPGGVWQEDLLGPNPHRAGEAVLAKTHPKYFRHLIRANTVAFISSFGIIILQIRGLNITIGGWWLALLSYAMWLSAAAIGITYAISFVTVAPESERGGLSTTGAIVIIIIMVWVYYCLAVAAREIYRMVTRSTRRSPSFQVDPDTSEFGNASPPFSLSGVYNSLAEAARVIYQMVTRRTRSPSLDNSDSFPSVDSFPTVMVMAPNPRLKGQGFSRRPARLHVGGRGKVQLTWQNRR